MARVAALTIYPLKSAAGVAVPFITLDAEGAAGDRRWVLVDPDGVAITARECHALLHITPMLGDGEEEGMLMLAAPGCAPLAVRGPGPDGVRTVRVWDDTVVARDAGDDAAAWVSEAIGRPARLVRLGDETRRPLRPKYTGGLPHDGRTVAFTDGAPLLVLGLPSVRLLQERLLETGADITLDRRRFRANIWLDDLAPHEEDAWRTARIGTVTVGLGTWCPRCVLTTVDPDTLQTTVEPLRTLATYRRHEGSVVFGVNTTHAAPGTIRVGDVVEVIERR